MRDFSLVFLFLFSLVNIAKKIYGIHILFDILLFSQNLALFNYSRIRFELKLHICTPLPITGLAWRKPE